MDRQTLEALTALDQAKEKQNRTRKRSRGAEAELRRQARCAEESVIRYRDTDTDTNADPMRQPSDRMAWQETSAHSTYGLLLAG